MKKNIYIFFAIFLTIFTVSCSKKLDNILVNITFDTMGGSIVNKQQVKKGDFVERPEKPTKDNYIFISWYDSNEYDNRYFFNNEVEDSFILYARWIEKDKINASVYYNNKDDVAIYLIIFEKLPSNYRLKEEVNGHISKNWTKENMLTIGGDIFFNRERLLPDKKGRLYKEADIDYYGESNRGAKRIVFSNDGLIYYTDDHYDSFIQYNEKLLSW